MNAQTWDAAPEYVRRKALSAYVLTPGQIDEYAQREWWLLPYFLRRVLMYFQP